MRAKLTAVVFVAALCLPFALAGCGGGDNGVSAPSSPGVKAAETEQATVDADYVASLPEAAVLVDTRTADEYREGHIPGALNASYPKSTGGPCQAGDNKASFLANWEKLGVAADAQVVLYCRSGVRAAAAADALRDLGYINIEVYAGSWQDWTLDSSRPVER